MARIRLSGKHSDKFTLVPDEVAPLLGPVYGRIDGGKLYVCTEYQGKYWQLHRLVLHLQGVEIEGKIVDHVGGDRLDQCNLRIVGNSANLRNRHVCKNEYHGVSFDTTRGRWQWQVMVNGHKAKQRASSELAAAGMFNAAVIYLRCLGVDYLTYNTGVAEGQLSEAVKKRLRFITEAAPVDFSTEYSNIRRSPNGKYVLKITRHGKKISLGTHPTIFDALDTACDLGINVTKKTITLTESEARRECQQHSLLAS